MKRFPWTLRSRSIAGSVLPLLMAMPCSEASEFSTNSATKSVAQELSSGGVVSRHPHLREEDRLGDLIHHPAFRGFSRRMLPWDERPVDENLLLREIGQLLPFHSHVDVGVVVSSLNRLVDDVNTGHPVFHDFHTDAERGANPSLRHTGLYFFRGQPGAPFALIAPGGGFSYVGSVHEGFPYAADISKLGFNAFVLKYRAGMGGTVATEDLATALVYIFKHSRKLQVDTAGYSLWGSSAGARMVAAIGSHGTARFGAASLPRPAAVVTAYTGHSEVAASEPSTFVVVGEKDGIAPPATMAARVAALRRQGTTVEYRVFPGVGHGFGTGEGTSAKGWIAEAVRFWQGEIAKSPQ